MIELNTLTEYLIGHAAIRERKIRAGELTPRLDDELELKWSREGPVPPDRLDIIHLWPKRVEA